MQDHIHRFRHHDIEGAIIRVLEDEELTVNEFLSEEHQLEDGNVYEFAYTCCYLKHRGKHILVDAGFDPDTTPGALESIDVFPEDIDLVLLTHADRDHVAGVLMHDGTLTYPHARHVISKQVWEHLSDPSTLEALDDERRAFYHKLARALDSSIELIDDESDIADGIRFIPHDGHRAGHAVYEFASSETPLIHSGDAFFHPIFAEHPDWANLTDSAPELAVESRKNLVERASTSAALILSTHIPFPGIGQIRKLDELLYQWIPIELGF